MHALASRECRRVLVGTLVPIDDSKGEYGQHDIAMQARRANETAVVLPEALTPRQACFGCGKLSESPRHTALKLALVGRANATCGSSSAIAHCLCTDLSAR